MNFHRGIAASPLLRMAAEMRPPQGFAEQQAPIMCTTTRMALGEALDDASGIASSHAVTVLLNSILAENSSFVEMLDLSVLGIFTTDSSYKAPAILMN
eukprot:CAMPEP_0169083968 /NCGR_PEP_ID=MMETSP1015-20121227/12360_1 /TAXON_ID=342587 /ORGANISM="Karlodinium micrum, Strain CCMP2283" /LENGTH=97 /DNA_ID=CAMNT_0009143925 /DNA_START=152 /DNA_END=445 /DNA_ORIENTATION=+